MTESKQEVLSKENTRTLQVIMDEFLFARAQHFIVMC